MYFNYNIFKGFFLFLFFKNRPPYYVEKERRLVCQKREFAARQSSCAVTNFQDVTFIASSEVQA